MQKSYYYPALLVLYINWFWSKLQNFLWSVQAIWIFFNIVFIKILKPVELYRVSGTIMYEDLLVSMTYVHYDLYLSALSHSYADHAFGKTVNN